MNHMPSRFYSLLVPLLSPVRILLLLVLLGQSSCTHIYHFNVDAIAGGEVQTSDSFFLTADEAQKNETGITNEEVSAYIETALESKGFRKAADLDSAETLIVYSFGVGEPVELLVIRGSNSANLLKSPTYAIRRDYESNGSSDGTTTHLVEVPSEGSEPVRDRVEREIVYEKFLKLEAYKNRPDASSETRERLWSIGIATADPSDDIREYLPYLLAAGLPYVAEESGEQISVELKSNDPMIEVIRASAAGSAEN